MDDSLAAGEHVPLTTHPLRRQRELGRNKEDERPVQYIPEREMLSDKVCVLYSL